MAALESNLDVTLTANRSGSTANIINDSLALEAIAFDEATEQVFELADAAVDQAVSLGGLTTVQTLLLISDRAISLKFNGTSTAIAATNVLLTGAAITSLSASNASGGLATVRAYMLGT